MSRAITQAAIGWTVSAVLFGRAAGAVQVAYGVSGWVFWPAYFVFCGILYWFWWQEFLRR